MATHDMSDFPVLDSKQEYREPKQESVESDQESTESEPDHEQNNTRDGEQSSVGDNQDTKDTQDKTQAKPKKTINRPSYKSLLDKSLQEQKNLQQQLDAMRISNETLAHGLKTLVRAKYGTIADIPEAKSMQIDEDLPPLADIPEAKHDEPQYEEAAPDIQEAEYEAEEQPEHMEQRYDHEQYAKRLSLNRPNMYATPPNRKYNFYQEEPLNAQDQKLLDELDQIQASINPNLPKRILIERRMEVCQNWLSSQGLDAGQYAVKSRYNAYMMRKYAAMEAISMGQMPKNPLNPEEQEILKIDTMLISAIEDMKKWDKLIRLNEKNVKFRNEVSADMELILGKRRYPTESISRLPRAKRIRTQAEQDLYNNNRREFIAERLFQ